MDCGSYFYKLLLVFSMECENNDLVEREVHLPNTEKSELGLLIMNVPFAKMTHFFIVDGSSI